jgi:carotenoid cleavage dioxygenase-like enzyme
MSDTVSPPQVRRTSENPYLRANFAPVEQELTAFDLPVTGAIPVELDGRWLRNGPNPGPDVVPAVHHWFMGAGMVHGVRLRGGRAEWYRNRYVSGDDGFSPNTNVGGFAGTTWAMVEAGTPPTELGYELESRGTNRFSGTLPDGFSAHPKYDPTTGELHAMAYHWPDLIDHVQYVVVGSDGRVSRVTDIPVADMPMIHDMSLTPTYAVVYDLPVTVNLDLVVGGSAWPFSWAPDRAARVGLLPRNGGADDIIWCDVDPCYVFHPLNAYDADDGTVVVDVCRYDRMMHTDRSRPVQRLSADLRPLGDRPEREACARDTSRRPATGIPPSPSRPSGSGSTASATPPRSTAEGPNLHGAIIKIDVEAGTTTEPTSSGPVEVAPSRWWSRKPDAGR